MRDSRRARLILALLLLTAFTLITLDFRSGGGGPLRRFASAVFGPIENAIGDVARPVGSFFSGLTHLSSYKSENDRLRKENDQLQEQLRLTDNQRAELADLQKLFHLTQIAQFRIVAARVTAVGSSLGFESTATIDVGSNDGVRRDMTVVNGSGLVGRTLEVGPSSATILLADDTEFSAGARLEGSQEIGHVDGHGRNPMTFTLLDSQAGLQVNQRLVTFGSIGNRPFVPEVPIGRITRVRSTPGALTRTAVVAPYAHFSSLDVVAVVVATPRTIKRDSLLPPSPTPSPTPTSASPSPGVSLSPGASGSPSPGSPSPGSPGPGAPGSPTPPSTAPSTTPSPSRSG